MNNPTTSDPSSGTDGYLESEQIGGFDYAVGVSAGIVVLFATITLISYFCTRNQTPPRAINRNEHDCIVDIGLDEATLLSYPKLLYSEAKVNYNEDSTASTCCSICLADYKDNDMLRLLQDCGHLFHLKCVDSWLMLNPSCPICRTSPLPSPLSTPLAEVVPLASRPSVLMLHA
ncbi:RING-H2 finger protein ATL70-like [Lycium ferocissimum]|uniref:RING-H2 finger protein ATL70-like n=1 Tax=Lycium ferocissimum TaxID=112874 RepID=UPI0028157849|nr:RING-H2 finger protein ATL70-like [Lycium ferocissimum]